ncbi:hypothetical protein [Streptomyces canus]|uniref:hypothetical protein n=1 Tax=Streptomyces canus TaxID=58343 RepID=UPI002E30472B|nr:hypothetical protein [Streptomyces canus]
MPGVPGGLVADLQRLAELHEECGLALAAPGTSGPPVVRRSGRRPHPGLPLDAEAVEVRGAILRSLSHWATLLVERYGAAAPRRTPHTLADFLGTQVGRLAAHPVAADITCQARELVRRASRVVEPARRRPTIGACAEPGCAGELTTLLHSDGSDRLAEISCTADPAHTWTGEGWLRLSRRLAAANRTAPTRPTLWRWLGSTDISRLWNIAPGSVYRLAREEGWRRTKRARQVKYHEQDVQRTFDRRSARATRRGA